MNELEIESYINGYKVRINVSDNYEWNNYVFQTWDEVQDFIKNNPLPLATKI